MLDLKSTADILNVKHKSSNLKVRVYNFSLEIIRFSTTLPNKRIYWIIMDQLIRSATSIGANIIEAQAASSRRDFIKFYEIALKSANETKYWLSLLKDSNLVEVQKEKTEKLIEEVDEICKMTGSSLLTLKGKRF